MEYQARDLAERDEHDDALRLAEESFQHGNREALTGLAWRYTGPDLPRAFAVMRRAMALGFDDAITEMVILATTANDPALVTRYCDLAIESGHPNAQRVAGHVLARSGDERRGEALLWRAFNGGLHRSLFELAELRERQGRVRAARRLYRRLTSVGQVFALVKLAASYEQAGDQATAEHLAAKYARLEHLGPKDSGWHWVAKARYRRGDHAGAKRLLGRLASAGDTHALVTMAEWAIKTGDRPEAEAAVNRAIDSGAPGAKKLLLQLRQSSE
ncbi:tetratricopeptide repeat protein [Micromonospora sp. NPDC050417]|uniref:tetratricopeptide repeat protein n=1 Tax=Micromonospora sp. NPDC050417 TaxID=3364280 RepID=UPI0037AD4A74